MSCCAIKKSVLAAACLAASLGLSAKAQSFPVEKCVNLSNFLEVAPDLEWAYDFDISHIKAIRDAGFDSLRIPARLSSYWDGNRLDPRFMQLLKSVVREAQKHGLYVIVDVHHFDELVQNPPAHAEAFVQIWQAVSESFAGSTGLAFELLNEPHDALKTEFLLPYYDRAIEAIRTHHPDAWIIMGTDNWGGINGLKSLPRPDDARIIHTFHFYEPFEFTHQQAEWFDTPFPESSWGSAAETAELTARIGHAAAHHTQTFLGEFGTYHRAPRKSRLAWIEATRQAAEANGIGWCHWGFGAGFGLFDTKTGQFDAGVLSALGLKPPDQ